MEKSGADKLSPAVYGNSKTFTDKIKIPLRSNFFNKEGTFLSNDLEVSRFNGIFWKKPTTRTCVLLRSGKFYIYSDIDRGLSINLAELREVRQQYSEKETKEGAIKASCEFLLLKNNNRLKVYVKGDKSFVTSWRCGLVTAHNGLELPYAEETDEFTWSQKIVDPLTTSYDTFVNSMADRALKSNTSMPSLALAYQTLPNTKYSEITTLMRKTNSLCFDRSDRSVPSFLVKNETPSSFESDDGGVSMEREPVEHHEWKSVIEENDLDSGVDSHYGKFSDTCDETSSDFSESISSVSSENWKDRSRFTGLPMLCAHKLNIERAVRIPEYKYEYQCLLHDF